MSTIAEDFKKKYIVDQNAETIKDICKEMPFVSYKTVDTMVKEKLASGEYEQVWKKQGPKLVPAYRKTKKKG